MNNKFQLFAIVSVVFIICVVSVMEPAVAGPGGKIAAAVFNTFWGKVLLFGLVIFFLPLILYNFVIEYLAQRRTFKDLRKLAQVNKLFDWLTLRDRITDCFYRVHAAWREEDMAEASQWMAHWYWQNQQLAYLDQWAKDGLVNHCRVKRISHINPLFLAYRSDEQQVAEGSRIVVSITANMEDYLAERETGQVVEGKKGFQSVETVWTFIVQNGQWVVANIDEDSLSLAYTQLANELPAYIDGYDINKEEKTF